MNKILFLLFFAYFNFAQSYVVVEKNNIVNNGLYDKVRKEILQNCDLKKITFSDFKNDNLDSFHLIVYIGAESGRIKDKFNSLTKKIFLFFDKNQKSEAQTSGIDTVVSSTKVNKQTSWDNIKKMIEDILKKNNIKC